MKRGCLFSLSVFKLQLFQVQNDARMHYTTQSCCIITCLEESQTGQIMFILQAAVTCAPRDMQIIFQLMLRTFFFCRSRHDDSWLITTAVTVNLGPVIILLLISAAWPHPVKYTQLIALFSGGAGLSFEECLLYHTVNLPVRMGLTAAASGGCTG